MPCPSFERRCMSTPATGARQGFSLVRASLLALLVALVAVLSAPAASAAEDYRGLTRKAVNGYAETPAGTTAAISRERAARIARRHVSGKVLSVKPAREGGYRVRVLSEGARVVTIAVDAKGRIAE